MKIILSRKGFDSSNGGCPSPIMPDGTLLSMPIPSEDDEATYDDLEYKGTSYTEILKGLRPKGGFNRCHVDPDIRENCRKHPVKNWRAAFGQIGAAQGLLTNAGVESGDIFLFFGWFRPVEFKDGRYQYVSRKTGSFYDHADMHIIYGYLQIGEIHKDLSSFPWHPHASYTGQPNAIYTAADKLSLDPKLKGYGTLDYRKDRVLTMENCNRGTWIPHPFLMPEHIYGDRKNGAKGEGLYYPGIWQELVISESEGLMDWMKKVLTDDK